MKKSAFFIPGGSLPAPMGFPIRVIGWNLRFKWLEKAFILSLFVITIGSAFAQNFPANYIPQYAIEEAERFKAEFLIENAHSASDLKYRFYYNDRGEGCLEYTVTPKGGYRWSQSTWVGMRWGNFRNGSIGNGQIYYSITRRNKDLADYRIEERRKDPVFNEIEQIVYQLALEYDYDWESAYRIRVKYRNPNIKKAVCDGYSDAAIRALANHSYVEKVEKWSSSRGNHAWNVIVLKDGRKIYCDVTWYDGQSIDDEGFVVTVPERDPVNLTFDINEFNSLGGALNQANNRALSVHFGWNDARLVN